MTTPVLKVRPTQIKEGTTGCVMTPAYTCGANPQPNYSAIAKLFPHKDEYEREVNNYTKFIKTVDPSHDFTIEMTDHCTTHKENYPINTCVNFNDPIDTFPSGETEVPQIIYPNVGIDLRMAAKSHSFKTIFSSLGNIFNGLVRLNSAYIGHFDITANNILFDVKTSTAKLIDYGTVKEYSEYYDQKANWALFAKYPFYPPELELMRFNETTAELASNFLTNTDYSLEFGRKSLDSIVNTYAKYITDSKCLALWMQLADVDYNNLVTFLDFNSDQPLKTLLTTHIGKFDVFMLGMTILTLFTNCLVTTPTMIDEDPTYYHYVFTLIKCMTEFLPVDRITAIEASNIYRKIIMSRFKIVDYVVEDYLIPCGKYTVVGDNSLAALCSMTVPLLKSMAKRLRVDDNVHNLRKAELAETIWHAINEFSIY